MNTATIFNILHYSIHDGPGIRTTVFFKGCPLSCKWCHNPEGIDEKPQQTFDPKKCINCGRCSDCPSGARETIGYKITVTELMKEINKDVLFYEQSGGGVTFSGGEPMLQADFLLEVLAQCRDEHIKTAIDTSGYCDTRDLLKAAEFANCFLFDIKCIDSKKHKTYCGASNDIILNNLKYLAGTKSTLLIRIPVIPSINDSMHEMKSIYEFIKGFLNIDTVHLLPYHNIQSDKYKRLGMQYGLDGIPGESPNMDDIVRLFSTSFRTRIGG